MTHQHPSLFERALEAASFLVGLCPDRPTAAIVLGSGLGEFVDRIENPIVLPYGEVPHFPGPTVAGHQGMLFLGRLEGKVVAVFQGRFHHYEGHDFEAVTFPVRVLQALGTRQLILTAAVGGIAPNCAPGDIVCIRDHLNLLGANPLRGPNDDRLGIRFLDLSEVYSSRLRACAESAAGRLGITLQHGVYACVTGPCYETPAEVRMLRTLGADVVGMSTVPEAIVARHAGMDVLALALVANLAAGRSATRLCHEDVLEGGRAAGPRMASLLEAVLRELPIG